MIRLEKRLVINFDSKEYIVEANVYKSLVNSAELGMRNLYFKIEDIVIKELPWLKELPSIFQRNIIDHFNCEAKNITKNKSIIK